MPSADQPGKGSRRRPPAVSEQELERRWRVAFEKKQSKRSEA